MPVIEHFDEIALDVVGQPDVFQRIAQALGEIELLGKLLGAAGIDDGRIGLRTEEAGAQAQQRIHL